MRSITFLKLSLCFGLTSFVYGADKYSNLKVSTGQSAQVEQTGVLDVAAQQETINEQWASLNAQCSVLSGDQNAIVKTTLRCTDTRNRLKTVPSTPIPFDTRNSLSASVSLKGQNKGTVSFGQSSEAHETPCDGYVEVEVEAPGFIEYPDCAALASATNPVKECEAELAKAWTACDEEEAEDGFDPKSVENTCSYRETGTIYTCDAPAQQEPAGKCDSEPVCDDTSSGTSGTSGTSCTSPTSETSGTSGTSCTSGTSETSGTSGTSCTSGTSETSGTSGTSCTSPTSETSGTSGTSCTSGTSETSGTSGTSCTSGTSETSGTSGTSCTSPTSLSSNTSSSDCLVDVAVAPSQKVSGGDFSFAATSQDRILGGGRFESVSVEFKRTLDHDRTGVQLTSEPSNPNSTLARLNLTPEMKIVSIKESGRMIATAVSSEADVQNYLAKIQKKANKKEGKEIELNVKYALEADGDKQKLKDHPCSVYSDK